MIACPGVPGTFCLDDEFCGQGKKCQAVLAKAARDRCVCYGANTPELEGECACQAGAARQVMSLLYTASDVVLGCRVEDGRLLVQLGNPPPPAFPLLFGPDERLVIETDGQAVTLRRERSK